MKSILAITFVAAAAGFAPLAAGAAPMAEMTGMKGMASATGASAAMGHGQGGMRHGGMNRRRGGRCSPMVHDVYWLDYSRMRWGMNAGRSGANGGNGARDGQSASGSRMNRRMRMLRLKHNGFPPPTRGGCPSCRARAGGMKSGAVKDMAAAMKRQGRRGGGRRDASRRGGKPDPALQKAIIWLETPDNLIHRIDPGKPGVMKFNARMWGMHKIFAYLDGGQRNGVKRRYFAFYDLFSHGDEVSKNERPVLDGNGYWKGQPEFNLERVYENDRQRYRTQTGETAKFRLTFRGKPVKGACVVMITQKDWRKAGKTDENGEVSFFIIKEMPNESGWRARRRSEKYLVVARHFVPEGSARQDGARAGTRYMAARMMRVRPSRLEWESKSTAFIVGSFTMVAAGAAIAIRRSRRRRRTRGAA